MQSCHICLKAFQPEDAVCFWIHCPPGDHDYDPTHNNTYHIIHHRLTCINEERLQANIYDCQVCNEHAQVFSGCPHVYRDVIEYINQHNPQFGIHVPAGPVAHEIIDLTQEPDGGFKKKRSKRSNKSKRRKRRNTKRRNTKRR